MIGLQSAVRVANLFWPEFDERGGVVLLAGTRIGSPLAEFSSASEYELFYTHTHVLEEFRHSIPVIAHPDGEIEFPDLEHREFPVAWELAKRIGQMLRCKLACDFPEKRFRVYVTRLDDPIVRFHCIRESEPAWLSEAEGATMGRDDAVLVLET